MYKKLLATLFASVTLSLTACGGGSSSDTVSNFGSISSEAQERAGTAIAAAQIDSFVNALLIDLGYFENQGSGVTNLTCMSGTGTSNFVDTDNDTIFNNANTITISTTDCMTTSGVTLNGEYVYQSTNSSGTSFTTTYNNYSLDGDTLSGSLNVSQNNYNILGGSGSISITIPASGLTLGSQTISNGDYVINLISSTNYNYTANFTVSSPSTGALTAVTDTAFSGTYSYSSQTGATFDDPTVGYMTITAADNSTVTVNANTGNPSTLSLSSSGITEEFSW